MQEIGPVAGIAILLAAALVGGMVAHRLRQPVILGYLAIGVVVGPHALGIVGDLTLVEAVATVGVALLMFTLGLEISIDQLREVGRVGVWGGLSQVLMTFVLGATAGIALFNWPMPQSVLFGLIISLSSTAVCLKLLMERGELTSVHGRIMLAILILQDIAVILMMIVMPILGGEATNIPLALGMALVKATLFIGIAIVSGLWLLPWLIGRIGGVRSRELFLLTILVLSLGAAVSTQIFGLSMVFGAFLVGLVLRGPQFGYQAVAEVTPLRDIFATLFFVSLGMLLDLSFIVERWLLVIATVAVVILIKMVIVFGIVRMFGYRNRIAVLSGTGLFQIGEFGFIIAQGGLLAGLVSHEFYSLILSTAIITMLLTPLSLGLVGRFYAHRLRGAVMSGGFDSGEVTAALATESKPPRVVVAGYGRIGRNVVHGLGDFGVPFMVIEIDPKGVAALRRSGKPRIYGDASNAHVLAQAGLKTASTLVVTFPDPLAVVNTVKAALEIKPELKIVARVHRSKEANLLRSLGVKELVSPEYEASLEILKRTLAVSGWKKTEIKHNLPALQQDKGFAEFGTGDEV